MILKSKNDIHVVFFFQGITNVLFCATGSRPVLFMLFMFVCLGFSSLSRMFHSYGDIAIADERLQILTYARRSWPLSSGGSSLCNAGRPFKLVISEDPWHSHTCIAGLIAVELSLPVFLTKVCCDWDSNTKPSSCGVNALTYCATAAVGPFWVRVRPLFIYKVSYKLGPKRT